MPQIISSLAPTAPPQSAHSSANAISAVHSSTLRGARWHVVPGSSPGEIMFLLFVPAWLFGQFEETLEVRCLGHRAPRSVELCTAEMALADECAD
jgi:hypothetical protein